MIPRLARDIRNELPEVKGYSERNIGYMIRFAHEYGPPPILQRLVAKLTGIQQLVVHLPWGQNIILMEKVKDHAVRYWYMRASLQQGWSRDVLALMIEGQAHERQGNAVTNFVERLPPQQSDMAQQALKDPYIFDFLTLDEPFHERELETALVRHLEKFLIELGQGFAFVGRQVHVDVGDEDFYTPAIIRAWG